MFQKLVLRTPLVAIPTLIGEVEQDYLYWPLKYKAITARWRRETAWGALFECYQQEGSLAAPHEAQTAASEVLTPG